VTEGSRAAGGAGFNDRAPLDAEDPLGLEAILPDSLHIDMLL
jgi:hypothetical protein